MPSPKTAAESTRPRDAARTRRLILEAAFDEFTAKGFAGARVEAVAERAGVNVRALYKYFGSKDGLYEAVFGDGFADKHAGALAAIEQVVTDPDAVRRLLPELHDLLSGNPAFTRLMTWDALAVASADDGRRVVAADVRQNMYDREVEALRQAQRANGIWPGLDPDLLLIAMMGLVIHPHASAPLTKMITGISSDSPQFRRRWDAFLTRIGELLSSGAPVPAAVDRLPDDSTDDNRLLRMASRALARAGLVTAYGHVSLRIDDNAFLVSAPMPLGLITVERGTVVPVHGDLPEGVLGEVRAHQAIYRRRPDVRAIARVLPPSVRALSALGRTTRSLDGVGSYFAPAPPLWNDPQLARDHERAEGLAQTHGEAPAGVMRGNGAIVVADTLPKAVVLARYLEDASALDLAVRAAGNDPVELTVQEAAARALWTGDIAERMWAYLTHGDPESSPL